MTGCSTYVSNIEGQAFAPIDPPVKLSSPRPANGSIFHSSQNGLFATDQRARRVGDILTVSFNETYSATKAQTASSSKADNFGVTLPTGLPNIFTGGFDKDAGGNGAGLSAGTTRSFAGAGNAVQSNSFSGLLSVTVVRVFENGNMEVAGQKELMLNNGNEYVRVRGVVRPEDVSANNIVSSNRLADAQIRYTGSGQLADSSKQGWLSELMRTFHHFKGMSNLFSRICVFGILAVSCLGISIGVVKADRLKDMTSIAGVRSNQLVGYGLVVGLAGTGDGNAVLTQQAMQSMISQFGVVTNASDMNGKNAASVIVTADLPPFIKPGQKLDVVVSTVGQAKSLRGGTLLMTPLLGADGETYAIAQGNLMVGGLGVAGGDGSSLTVNVPTVGRIPGGGSVERMIENTFLDSENLYLICIRVILVLATVLLRQSMKFLVKVSRYRWTQPLSKCAPR